MPPQPQRRNRRRFGHALYSRRLFSFSRGIHVAVRCLARISHQVQRADNAAWLAWAAWREKVAQQTSSSHLASVASVPSWEKTPNKSVDSIRLSSHTSSAGRGGEAVGVTFPGARVCAQHHPQPATTSARAAVGLRHSRAPTPLPISTGLRPQPKVGGAPRRLPWVTRQENAEACRDSGLSGRAGATRSG